VLSLKPPPRLCIRRFRCTFLGVGDLCVTRVPGYLRRLGYFFYRFLGRRCFAGRSAYFFRRAARPHSVPKLFAPSLNQNPCSISRFTPLACSIFNLALRPVLSTSPARTPLSLPPVCVCILAKRVRRVRFYFSQSMLPF